MAGRELSESEEGRPERSVISDPDDKYRMPELSHGLRLHFVYMTTDACTLPEAARTLELLRGYRKYWGESDPGYKVMRLRGETLCPSGWIPSDDA
jgi:hypothetical protein